MHPHLGKCMHILSHSQLRSRSSSEPASSPSSPQALQSLNFCCNQSTTARRLIFFFFYCAFCTWLSISSSSKWQVLWRKGPCLPAPPPKDKACWRCSVNTPTTRHWWVRTCKANAKWRFVVRSGGERNCGLGATTMQREVTHIFAYRYRNCGKRKVQPRKF